MNSLEQWLAGATRGLSAESAARIRAEIQQHYDSACEAGDDAIAALGDPRAANRAYRKVLLTESEAMLAPVLTQPKRSLRSVLVIGLLASLWLLSPVRPDPGSWPVLAAILSLTAVYWLYPAKTLERSRAWVFIHGIWTVLVVAISVWYRGWMYALFLGAVCFWVGWVSSYRRFSIFRKLAAGQTFSLLPEEPPLTHAEAMYLHALQNGERYENASIACLFVMLAAGSFVLPATCLPAAIWMAGDFLARRILPIYTEERSRWFRIARWTTMAAAAVLPLLYGAHVLPLLGAVWLASFFLLFDLRRIALRRKLPASKWPQRLYC